MGERYRTNPCCYYQATPPFRRQNRASEPLPQRLYPMHSRVRYRSSSHRTSETYPIPGARATSSGARLRYHEKVTLFLSFFLLQWLGGLLARETPLFLAVIGFRSKATVGGYPQFSLPGQSQKRVYLFEIKAAVRRYTQFSLPGQSQKRVYLFRSRLLRLGQGYGTTRLCFQVCFLVAGRLGGPFARVNLLSLAVIGFRALCFYFFDMNP